MTAVHDTARLPGEDERVALVQRHLRRNVGGLGLDFGLFIAGASFATQATVVVAFAAFLGAPTIVLGAIPAIQTVGRIRNGRGDDVDLERVPAADELRALLSLRRCLSYGWTVGASDGA